MAFATSAKIAAVEAAVDPAAVAKHEDKPTPQKKQKAPAANSRALEVARRP